MKLVDSVSIVRTEAALGAEVRGVNLAGQLDDETFRQWCESKIGPVRPEVSKVRSWFDTSPRTARPKLDLRRH